MVDGPADGVGDLLVGVDRAGAEAHRDRQEVGLGRDADHAVAGRRAASREQRADEGAVGRVVGADRALPVGGADCPDMSVPPDDGALQLADGAVDARVDHGDGDARAARRLPRLLRRRSRTASTAASRMLSADAAAAGDEREPRGRRHHEHARRQRPGRRAPPGAAHLRQPASGGAEEAAVTPPAPVAALGAVASAAAASSPASPPASPR